MKFALCKLALFPFIAGHWSGLAIAATEPVKMTANVAAGTVDAGTVDAGTVDAGTVDAGTVDVGTVDAGTAVGGTLGLTVLDFGTSTCSSSLRSDEFTCPLNMGVWFEFNPLNENGTPEDTTPIYMNKVNLVIDDPSGGTPKDIWQASSGRNTAPWVYQNFDVPNEDFNVEVQFTNLTEAPIDHGIFVRGIDDDDDTFLRFSSISDGTNLRLYIGYNCSGGVDEYLNEIVPPGLVVRMRVEKSGSEFTMTAFDTSGLQVLSTLLNPHENPATSNCPVPSNYTGVGVFASNGNQANIDITATFDYFKAYCDDGSEAILVDCVCPAETQCGGTAAPGQPQNYTMCKSVTTGGFTSYEETCTADVENFYDDGFDCGVCPFRLKHNRRLLAGSIQDLPSGGTLNQHRMSEVVQDLQGNMDASFMVHNHILSPEKSTVLKNYVDSALAQSLAEEGDIVQLTGGVHPISMDYRFVIEASTLKDLIGMDTIMTLYKAFKDFSKEFPVTRFQLTRLNFNEEVHIEWHVDGYYALMTVWLNEEQVDGGSHLFMNRDGTSEVIAATGSAVLNGYNVMHAVSSFTGTRYTLMLIGDHTQGKDVVNELMAKEGIVLDN